MLSLLELRRNLESKSGKQMEDALLNSLLTLTRLSQDGHHCIELLSLSYICFG